MRDRTAIEREIFDAREDLEQNIDRLMHKARERLAVRAHARHGSWIQVEATMGWVYRDNVYCAPAH